MQLRSLQLLGEGIFLEVEDLEIWARRLYHFRIVCEMLRLSSERHFFEATLGPAFWTRNMACTLNKGEASGWQH